MKVKVMIIDDEYIILDGLSSFPWNDYGCELVATAQNGAEGLNKLQEKDPDLVFTDIKMPQMDGLEFAQKARKNKPDLRIVFLTGYENFDYAQQAIRVSASEYLLKPMDFEKLDNLIKRITAEILSEKETKRYYKNLEEC
jgi:two-component system response regulator YesN